MRLFSLCTDHSFGERLASSLNVPLDKYEERTFEDGEHKLRPLTGVRDENVYVVQSLYGDEARSVDDKLCRLLFFIATLKDSGAKHITAVIPYLCYARKDRRTKARDPLTFRYVASLFEAVGTDKVVTIDVHNIQAFENGFRCNTLHLEAQKLFLAHFLEHSQRDEEIVVMSPDTGGVKRAEQFRKTLANGLSRCIDFAFMEKQRSEGKVTGETVVGNVEGKSVIILDDLISSGTTMARAARAARQRGATTVYAVATHGVFAGNANEALAEKSLKQIVVTNTIPPFRLNALSREKLVLLDVTPLLADVIRRLETRGSIVALMEADVS